LINTYLNVTVQSISSLFFHSNGTRVKVTESDEQTVVQNPMIKCMW